MCLSYQKPLWLLQCELKESSHKLDTVRVIICPRQDFISLSNSGKSPSANLNFQVSIQQKEKTNETFILFNPTKLSGFHKFNVSRWVLNSTLTFLKIDFNVVTDEKNFICIIVIRRTTSYAYI